MSHQPDLFGGREDKEEPIYSIASDWLRLGNTRAMIMHCFLEAEWWTPEEIRRRVGTMMPLYKDPPSISSIERRLRELRESIPNVQIERRANAPGFRVRPTSRLALMRWLSWQVK